MDIYNLSRNFFDWSFENPEKITPSHTALYFFAIEHCNRLGWKEKFGFPSQMAMEAIGIKSYNTYSKIFGELVEWGFFTVIQKSVNQYSANIIALSKNDKATNKALDKALIKHKGKQRESTSESNDSIDIQVYKETSIQKNREILKNKIDNTSKDSIKYDFYTFLYNMDERLKENITEKSIQAIEDKLSTVVKKIGKESIILELENFMLYHTTEKTVFKSALLRLNTWFNKK